MSLIKKRWVLGSPASQHSYQSNLSFTYFMYPVTYTIYNLLLSSVLSVWMTLFFFLSCSSSFYPKAKQVFLFCFTLLVSVASRSLKVLELFFIIRAIPGSFSTEGHM